MAKKTVRDIDVEGRRVLVRVDFNVPLDHGRIADDTRIRAALPTVGFLREKGARIILVSHLGRPKGTVVDNLRMDPIATRLEELLGAPVQKVGVVTGPEAVSAVDALGAGEVLLLENSRFDSRETANDPDLARELAEMADVFVMDAFGAAHRAHATTAGVAEHLPAVAGLLLEEELTALSSLVSSPQHPMVVVLGGVKVEDKIGVIDRFVEIADSLLVGGAMCFTFLKAQGHEVGDSKVDEGEGIEQARAALDKARETGCALVLPQDIVAARSFDAEAETAVVSAAAIPEGWMGFDIGPATREDFSRRVGGAAQVFWNGPMGAFELEPFAAGTYAVARAVAGCSGHTVVGGGDSVAALTAAGLVDQIDHVSTGGGAALEYVEGKELPGVAVLLDR